MKRAPASGTPAAGTRRLRAVPRATPSEAKRAGEGRAAVPRRDLFRERLGALERLVDAAVAETGTGSARSGRMAEVFDGLLGSYAEVARVVDARGLLGAAAALWRDRPTPEIDDFGYDRAFEESVGALFRALYRTWWRVEVSGIENVPAEGRALLVANHAGGLFAYDGAMLKVALLDEHPAHRTARPLVDDFVYELPFVGTFMSRCGAVRACQENATRLLRRDEVVIVFPEGTKGIGKPYEERYRLARFGRGGYVRIALRTRSPIVPVAIIGSEEIHPILGRWDWLARMANLPYFPLTPTFPWLGLLGLIPLPSKWRIEFGAPIDWTAQYEPSAADDRLLVSRLSEEVRRRVQQMVAEALPRRGPAFF